MKKLLVILFVVLALSLCGVLVACGEPNDSTGGNDDDTLLQFSGITFEDGTFVNTGAEHSIEVQGTLPQGTTVSYVGNHQTQTGVYNVTATVQNEKYQTLVLQAKLYIYDLADILQAMHEALAMPQPWSYLPESLYEQSLVYDSLPSTDFTTNVSVGNIGKTFIGVQLNVVYELMQGVQSALNMSNVVFAAADTIATTYQAFVNSNPNLEEAFEGEITLLGVKFSALMKMDGTVFTLLAGNGTVNVELQADIDSGTREGRIQVTDGVVLKYAATDNSLQLAVQTTVGGVGYVRQVLFTRDSQSGDVAGHLYEFMGVGTTGLKTSALIYSNSQYTYITANKRESDDLIINAYQEVYRSSDGRFVGAEVAETVELVDFDTIWVPLYDISGIDSIKVIVDEKEGELVYVNGSSEQFVAAKGLNLSRKYDIELKQVYYVTAVQDGDNVTYQRQQAYIPMMFVQKKFISSFTDDVNGKNSYINATLPLTTFITQYFESNMDTYLQLKEVVTRDEVLAFIGQANSFFD